MEHLAFHECLIFFQYLKYFFNAWKNIVEFKKKKNFVDDQVTS